MSIECIECGEENSEYAICCINCGSELKKESEREYWKIKCKICGHIYDVTGPDVHINECKFCYDIFDKREIAKAIPYKVKEFYNNDLKVLCLYEVFEKKTMYVYKDGIIGRAGDISVDFFALNKNISEKHCKLFVKNNKWYVEHIGNTNPTYLNGKKMDKGIPKLLETGDRLRIVNLPFIITLMNASDIYDGVDVCK